MTATITLCLPAGVRIVVPDSIDLITPYVLLEQGDWFEDEIAFVRHLLQPGQKVVDIGANYGVYALSMAHSVGPTGRVWAFEPASSSARMLAEAIALNGFSRIVLEQVALSDHCGEAHLSLNENSELNALLRGAGAAGASEAVLLRTLDDRLEGYGWRDIDFVKIDAEGEETNILKGGRRFLTELSPLIQYEVKVGAEIHMELVHRFDELGFGSYRLVPGLELLVPFDATSPPDGYLLNLFCCKGDRAEQLAANGFLLNSMTDPARSGTDRPALFKYSNAYNWRNTIARLPYGLRLEKSWEQRMTARHSEEVDRALSLHAISQDSHLNPRERFGALEASYNLLKTTCEREPSYLRLASLARVAREFGERSVAVNALQQLSNTILRNKNLDPSEPFLAPGRRFDSIPPGEAIGNWVLSGVLEEFEKLGSFSSFYTGVSARQRLELIHSLGFGSEEMDRRLLLLKRRFALS